MDRQSRHPTPKSGGMKLLLWAWFIPELLIWPLICMYSPPKSPDSHLSDKKSSLWFCVTSARCAGVIPALRTFLPLLQRSTCYDDRIIETHSPRKSAAYGAWLFRSVSAGAGGRGQTPTGEIGVDQFVTLSAQCLVECPSGVKVSLKVMLTDQAETLHDGLNWRIEGRSEEMLHTCCCEYWRTLATEN